MGSLFIVSTPIGNMSDISVRAIETMFSVGIIVCEDTRKTGLLLSELKKRYPSLIPHPMVKAELIRSDEFTEFRILPDIIGALRRGSDVALVTDAGTPLVGDPGFLLVREALNRGIPVTAVPGPTAAVCALTVSGLPANRYLFLGFLPEKAGHRRKLLDSLKKLSGTGLAPVCIIYCAPHKLEQTLTDIRDSCGDLEITVARELTKVHEEIWQGRISGAIRTERLRKGEIVLLINLSRI
ncbi:16S rRNA (cytidine(1402)-2'-O)-methyltransferase [Candidatus Gottesmanbacteria bacterium RBG_16_52_11]|uniref:Ribosomal RNA small subunit methyltransferase I n=1 Tax=Candidatus Gottesmanbacteria bacterium RBG_16_52_11 TaxID=1798374 RepID=A0A1F5YQQ8_9BACT|nr:MAG: 16S rRNA (cytidine(1402)-2'-O)-methyltransferase [Candidatus Gottesmanbacteria bacterium RBG_16_52_11]